MLLDKGLHAADINNIIHGGKICTLDAVTRSKGDSLNRKVNEVLVASKSPFLTDMGHSIWSFFFFFLLPSTGAFFKFSPYNGALYTIKPSLTPPPRQLPVSDLETQVICHQRGELEETASPAWELHAGPGSSQCCSSESLNIVKQSSRETGMEKWCQSVSNCVSLLLPDCLLCEGCVCVWAYMRSPVSVFSQDEA